MLMQSRVVMNLDVLYPIITLITHDERDCCVLPALCLAWHRFTGDTGEQNSICEKYKVHHIKQSVSDEDKLVSKLIWKPMGSHTAG